MQPPHPTLVLAALLTLGTTLPARAQTDPPAGQVPMPAIRIVIPAGEGEAWPAPVVTEAPPADEFLVIPLRVHLLAAGDVPAVDCHLTDDDIRRVVGKLNGIWHKAGIHWALDPIVREPAAAAGRYRAALAEAQGEDRLDLLRMLAPEASRSAAGVDVYYIHAFEANGVYLGDRTAFVQETAQLRPVPGGSDEPLPRVTAHELGHALGLPHRQARTNLLASGTTGTLLNRAEVDRVRSRAPTIPGALTVPDLRRRRAEAQARSDAGEADRIDAILRALPAEGPASPP